MYKLIKNRITEKYRDGNEKWFDVKYENIKANMTTNRMEKAQEIIKELSRIPNSRSRIVKDKNGLLILDESKIGT